MTREEKKLVAIMHDEVCSALELFPKLCDLEVKARDFHLKLKLINLRDDLKNLANRPITYRPKGSN